MHPILLEENHLCGTLDGTDQNYNEREGECDAASRALGDDVPEDIGIGVELRDNEGKGEDHNQTTGLKSGL